MMSPMIQTRKCMEAAEGGELAPYAVRSADSRGRRHAEPAHAYRTEFPYDYVAGCTDRFALEEYARFGLG